MEENKVATWSEIDRLEKVLHDLAMRFYNARDGWSNAARETEYDETMHKLQNLRGY